VVHEDRPLKNALSLMRQLLRRNSIDDRLRRRSWGVEFYQKPGYIRRQEKFFAKVKARHDEQFHRMTNGEYRGLK
jgi:hypothetical protein